VHHRKTKRNKNIGKRKIKKHLFIYHLPWLSLSRVLLSTSPLSSSSCVKAAFQRRYWASSLRWQVLLVVHLLQETLFLLLGQLGTIAIVPGLLQKCTP
jgi:hypothetical protein